jgi:hypothetical protein
MTNNTTDKNASNSGASTTPNSPKTTCPAAGKFAEYLARRMGPMIEHASRRKEQNPQPRS